MSAMRMKRMMTMRKMTTLRFMVAVVVVCGLVVVMGLVALVVRSCDVNRYISIQLLANAYSTS
jgi:hypothetical protein